MSPVLKVPDTTSPTWQQRHAYNKCMAACPRKAGAFTDEHEANAAEAKSKSYESFATFFSASTPRDAPCGYRPDWSSLSEKLFKICESHTQVIANKKAQACRHWTSMVAKLSCGEGFAKGEANLARAIERKDVIVRNNVYYEPTHALGQCH